MDEVSDEIGTSEVHAALEAWARWAKTVLAALGFPSISIIGRVVEMGILGAASSGGVHLVEIDQTCELVDRAILRLDSTEREVIARTYLFNDAAQVTAHKCGLTYQYYRLVLHRSRKRIGDFLEGAKARMRRDVVLLTK